MSAHRAALRGSPPARAGDRKIHAGRAPCRHRRRQPCGDGQRPRRGQSVPAPARPAEVPAGLLAQPPQPVLPVLRPVHRPDQPASAHRRGAPGRPNELEIAFSQVSPFSQTPPWLTDRMFRNILADMTGNTHRTEFCIDKMYAPAGAAGGAGWSNSGVRDAAARADVGRPDAADARRGRRVLAAAVRAAAGALGHPAERRVSCCRTTAIRISRRCSKICTPLGFTLDPEWFAPHLEFRFPHDRQGRGARTCGLELRNALEPWHVLAEEPAAGGTARYVDSSAERVQARSPAGPTSVSCWPATASRCR